MKIVTWNICCLPKWINQYQDPNKCIYSIIKILKSLNADIICLQELFDVNIRNLFLKYFQNYNIIYENTSSYFYFNSGLMILTKYTCVKSNFIPYKICCGEDRFSNKGFLYTVLKIKDTYKTVVNTHINNDEPVIHFISPSYIIKQQLKQLLSYIYSLKQFNKQVYLCGDFNSNKNTIIQNIPLSIKQQLYISGFSSEYTQITRLIIDHILTLSVTNDEPTNTTNDKTNVDFINNTTPPLYIFNTNCSDHCMVIKQYS